MDFSSVKGVIIPSGRAKRIKYDGSVIWEPYDVRYVSLGDSIAAGYRVEGWRESDEYSKGGNKNPTVITPSCYTGMIQSDIQNKYEKTRATSFACSGDTVKSLMDKLDDDIVKKAIEKADCVTACIGANDVLQPAMSHLDQYINGDMSKMNATIANNLANLANDSYTYSYAKLFEKLSSINSRASYVFTTIYNPYRHLHLDTGSNGFFGPMLSLIPDMRIDIDKIIEDMFLGGTDLSYYDITQFKWVSIELEVSLGQLIRDGILSTPAFQLIFDRANNLGSWAELYIEGDGGSQSGLNDILRSKIAEYQSSHPNFIVAEAKTLFDSYPARASSSAAVGYNDLVHVEFTSGYTTATMDWGALWRDNYGDNYGQYWMDLAWKYLSFKNALPSTNVWDYVGFDMNGFAADLANQVINKVIAPNVDPHPKAKGHEVLKQAFFEAKDW